MAAPSTISTIVGALAGLIVSWQTPNNVAADIADGIALLSAAHTADPGLPFATAALKIIGTEGASYENLLNNQAALVGTVGAEFNGEADKVVVLALRESSPLAKQLLGL